MMHDSAAPLVFLRRPIAKGTQFHRVKHHSDEPLHSDMKVFSSFDEFLRLFANRAQVRS